MSRFHNQSSKPAARTLLLAAGLLLMLAGCAPGPVPHADMKLSFLPQPGDFLAANGTRLSGRDLAHIVSQADYVLMGESHSSPCDHQAQSRLAWTLARAGVSFVLGLEMVPANKTEGLKLFNQGQLSPEELEAALDWENVWGYPFDFFLDTFRAAAAAGAPVYGLNVPSSLVKKTREMGLSQAWELEKLDPGERFLIPEEVIPPPEAQIESLEKVLTMHPGEEGGLNATERRDRFLLIQSVWDTAMAAEAVALHERYGRPVLVLAGETHVRRGYGIKHRLATLDPDARVVLFAGLRSLGGLDPQDADVYFYCPREHKSRMGMVLQERGGEVLVTQVDPKSRAAQAGLRPGDVILEAQGFEVSGLMDLHRAGSRAHKNQAELEMVIRRHGERYAVNLGELGGPRSR